MLTRLHWLPVDKRIVYKIDLLCHKVLIHKSPSYLALTVLTPYLPQRNLRSSSKQLLVVPTSSTCTYGDRAFASAAPILWNKLPDNLKTETDTSSFIKFLKTYLFLMYLYEIYVKRIENLFTYYALYKYILLLLLFR